MKVRFDDIKMVGIRSGRGSKDYTVGYVADVDQPPLLRVTLVAWWSHSVPYEAKVAVLFHL